MRLLYWLAVVAAVLAIGIFYLVDPMLRLLQRLAVVAAVLAIGIAVFAAVRWICRNRPKQSIPSPSDAPVLTSDQRLFVQEQVEHYRDEMLCYEIGLERHRRNTSKEVLLKILAGRGEITSMPILYLDNDAWMWENQQLREAVDIALRKLRLPIPTDVKEPTAQAAQACKQWAAAEAKRQFDKFLGA